MMKVPFLDLKVNDKVLKNNLIHRFEKILNHGQFLSGPEQIEFENIFAEEIGVKYALGVSSGSSALYLSLVANNIGPGDEVITTPYTWIITTNAIASVGATPVFVDVMEDFNIDPNKITEAITPKTKAILPMHVAGHMCDMKSIIQIAKENNLLIIEDAAQAFCSSIDGKRAGSFSDIAAFSMNPMKILHAYGEAGAVVTNNKKKIDLLKQLRHAGTKRYLNKNYHINKCNHISLNHKMDTIQASFLIEEINRMNKIKLKRDKLSDYYDNTLPHLGCNPQRIFNNEIHGRYYYMFICNKRNELLKYLTSMKIECKIFYSPLTCDVVVHKTNNHLKLPVARSLLRKCISIPMHENMSMNQAKYIVNCISKFYSK